MHSEVLTEEQRKLLPLLRVIPQRCKSRGCCSSETSKGAAVPIESGPRTLGNEGDAVS